MMRRVLVVFVLLVGVLVCPYEDVEAAMPSMPQFVDWASSLSTKVQTFATNELGVDQIQSLYESFSYADVTQNGTAVFEQLLADVDAKMLERVNALKALRDHMHTAYGGSSGSSGSSSYLRCCDFTGGEYSSNFYTNIGVHANCVRFPPGTSPPSLPAGVTSDLQASSSLIDVQQSNAAGSASLRWQYFGSQRGLFRTFPSSKSATCSSYDPRFRPWYVLAATPEPKDVIIVIDSSGSMLFSGRMSAAKEAAQVVLNTLNPNDYVNVLDFDSFTRTLTSPGCFSSTMAEATPRNREKLSDFVASTVASGGTYYTSALQRAYELLNNGRSNGDTSGGNRTILFLTDGSPSENNPSSILDYLEQQAEVNPDVVLLTYGFGNGLDTESKNRLASMASITGGISEIIPDGGDLRTQLGSYYDFFSVPNPNQEPVFTAPYWDASGLGLVVTAALPVYAGTTLEGVVGVDLTLTDLVSQVQYFKGGEYSFSFVTDDAGRTLTHPLLPAPDESSADAIILDIGRLEPSTAFSANVRSPMLAGQTGQYSLQLNRAFSRGDAATEGVVVRTLDYTVWFGPVVNANLRLGIALAHEDLELLELDETFLSSAAADAAVYHRIDLQSVAYCKQVGVAATKASATYKLSPGAFEDPSVYLDTAEDDALVDQWNRWVKGVTASTPFPVIDATSLRSDIIASNAIASFWKAADTDSIVWRYVGTNKGTFRMFPGAIMKRQYDPRTRPWFTRALVNKGTLAVSTPYFDAGGAGVVVTMSQAIYEGAGPHDTNDPFVAVAGMDFVVGRFWAMVQQTTGCSSSLTDSQGRRVECFVMDQSGYIIVHPAFLDGSISVDRMSDYFVAELYPLLAEKLVNPGNPILNQQRCNAWEDIQTNLFYTSKTRQVDALVGQLSGCDAEYALSTIPGTNAYLVAVAVDACVQQSSCSCGLSKYPYPATSDCQCPGAADLSFDTCSGTFELVAGEGSDPSCPPPPIQRSLQADDQTMSTTGMDTCYTIECESKETFLDCVQQVGCDFCEFAADGSELAVADWYCKEGTCPHRDASRDNDGGNGGTAAAPSRIVATLVVAMIAAVIATLL